MMQAPVTLAALCHVHRLYASSPLLDLPLEGDHGLTVPQPQRRQLLPLSLRQPLPNGPRPLQCLHPRLRRWAIACKLRAIQPEAR